MLYIFICMDLFFYFVASVFLSACLLFGRLFEDRRIVLFFFFLRLNWKSKAQAAVVAPAARVVVVPERHTAVPGVVAPAAATEHAVGARGSARRIGLRTAAIAAMPIATPLPHIATHIIETQFVRLLHADNVSFTVTIT